MWTRIVTNFFIVKPTRCTNFTNLFCHETMCFGQFVCPSSGVLFTVHSAMVYSYAIQVCRQFSSRTRMELSSILVCGDFLWPTHMLRVTVNINLLLKRHMAITYNLNFFQYLFTGKESWFKFPVTSPTTSSS
jgi:hypothetical protein